jgi:hypothetical protein
MRNSLARTALQAVERVAEGSALTVPPRSAATRALQLQENSCFVSRHDFSRAVNKGLMRA